MRLEINCHWLKFSENLRSIATTFRWWSTAIKPSGFSPTVFYILRCPHIPDRVIHARRMAFTPAVRTDSNQSAVFEHKSTFLDKP